MSNVPTTTNEIGGTIAAVPVRIVAGKSAVDEAGNVVESIPINIITGTPSTLPIVQLSTTTTTDELGRPLSVRPARIVAGATTTDSAGHVVEVIQVRDIGTGSITLGTLTLSGSLQIGTAASGTIIGTTAGSTITSNIPGITVNSGARTYSGTPTGSSGTISNGLVETLAGATNSPNNSSVTVSAATVTLGTLTLSGALKVGTATSGTIIGATAGSTIAGNIPGITINSGARTYSGTPTGSAATISNGLVETLAGATNSPHNSSVTVTATALPAQGNLVGDWDTTSLAVVADGTSVTSWTDSINSQVLTNGTAAPTYKNNAVGTKPSLSFNGINQYLTGASTQAMAAITANNFTIMVVLTNAQTNTGGYVVSATSGAGVNWRHNGASAGNPSGSETVLYTSTGFTTGILSRTSAYFSGHAAQHQVLLNGSLVSQQSAAFNGTLSQIAIGSTSTGLASTYFKGEVLRVLIWNKKLTLNEALQAERAIRDYYGQAYPWTAPGYYMLNVGDSITYGYGTTGRNNAWPYLLASALSLPFGAWSNLGFIGANATDCGNIAAAESLSNIPATIGVPVKVTYGEFYNQRSGATAPIASSASVIATQATLTALKAVGKVLFWDTTDYANRGAEKARWTGYWATPANQTGYMDAFVALSSDANIGVDLACPNGPPYGTYFSNGLNNFTCNGTVSSGSDLLTINSMTTGNGNVFVGASVTGTGIPAGTTIASLGTGTGGTGTYHMSANATASSTGSYSGGSGDGVHPGDGAMATFVSNFQAPFAAM